MAGVLLARDRRGVVIHGDLELQPALGSHHEVVASVRRDVKGEFAAAVAIAEGRPFPFFESGMVDRDVAFLLRPVRRYEVRFGIQ